MTFIGALSGNTSGGSNTGGSGFNLGSGGISGLASGINTDNIVNGLMQAAQVPLVSMLQQRQILQWQEDAYQRINSSLSTLQDSVSSMQLQSTFMTQSVSSSNTSEVNGTAGSFTASGTYNVTVSQLAQGATVSSSSVLSSDPNYGNIPLAQLPNNPLGANSSSSAINVTINGESFTFNPQVDTINTVMTAITSDSKTGVTAFYDPNAGKVALQTTATGSGAKIQVSADSANLFSNVFLIPPTSSVKSAAFATGQLGASNGRVEINGVKFQFTANESLSNVASAINAQSNTTGVQATADSTNQYITLSGVNLYSPISVSNPDNLSDQTTVLQLPATPATAAHDAYYSVNGFNSTNATNNPVFNGLTLDLQATTSAPVSVTVSTNTSGIVQSIQNFVQQYNTTLQTMQGFYNQQRNYDYQPLTSQQESQMTQTQIDEWNQKAQGGLLGNDPLLSSAMDSMQNVTGSIVNGQPTASINGQSVNINSLASIGITTIDPSAGVASGNIAPGVTTSGWNSYGLLQINTSTLTAAIQANPQAVMRLFTNSASASNGSTPDPTQTGLAVQLYGALTTAISQFTQEAGTSSALSSTTSTSLFPFTAIDPNGDFNALFAADSVDISFVGQEISDIDSRATNMQQQLSAMKQRYQTQFSNMEQALSQINSQSASLMSMLGQSSGSGSSGG